MYIEQAYKGENEVWKVVLTTLLCTGVFLGNLIFFLVAGDLDVQQMTQDALEIIPKNIFLAINLAVFIPILGLLFLLVWALHKRSILGLTTSRKKIDFGRIGFSFLIISIFTIGGFIISYQLAPDDFVLQFDAGNFIVLFIISLILFPFQIGLEEYLFRGYLMQQIGIMVRNRWTPLLITSVIFGIFHWANPEVAELGPIIMIFYIGTGLLLGIMTLMDEGLELALGFHFGNNFLAATLVTFEYSALQTDAIFLSTAEEGSALPSILPIFIIYPLILLILAKKYKWKGWKDKLFGAVVPPVQDEASEVSAME